MMLRYESFFLYTSAQPSFKRNTELYSNRFFARTVRGFVGGNVDRKIRIIAKPEQVKDDEISLLAREISKKIESELEYPGQIKVNVVRETRAIDYAK